MIVREEKTMNEPFIKQEIYKERLSDLRESEFELEEDIKPLEDANKTKKSSKNKGYKTPDLLTQMEHISQNKPSSELFQAQSHKKKKKKKKKNAQQHSQVPNKPGEKQKQDTVNSAVVKNIDVEQDEKAEIETSTNTSNVNSQIPDNKNVTKDREQKISNENDKVKEKQNNVAGSSNQKPKSNNDTKPQHINRSSGFVRNKEEDERRKEVAEKQKEKREETRAVEKATETAKKGNAKVVEIYNQSIFHPVAMKRAREKILSTGIPAQALAEESMLPFVLLLNKPKESYSDFFGLTITWMVTGYSNDGRSERLYLDLIKTPALIGDDEERNCDMAKVLRWVRDVAKEQNPNFEFSVLISRDVSKKKINEPTQIYRIETPFSIDGIISGTFVINGKKTIITGETTPVNIVRDNYEIYQKLVKQEYGKTPDDIKRYFRRYTRPLSDRERRLLYTELEYFASKAPMDEQLYILGLINEIKE